MEEQTGELLVVLEEERRPLDKMLALYPDFKKKFTSRLELPVFINDELVTFAQTYAKENGYKIERWEFWHYIAGLILCKEKRALLQLRM